MLLHDRIILCKRTLYRIQLYLGYSGQIRYVIYNTNGSCEHGKESGTYSYPVSVFSKVEELKRKEIPSSGHCSATLHNILKKEWQLHTLIRALPLFCNISADYISVNMVILMFSRLPLTGWIKHLHEWNIISNPPPIRFLYSFSIGRYFGTRLFITTQPIR